MSTLMNARIPASRILLPLILFALMVAVAACGDDDPARTDPAQRTGGETDNDDPEYATTGTVVFHAMEGGFYGIIGDDGERWDPVAFPDTLGVDSLRVEFHGEPDDLASSHMWGRPFRLSDIRKIADPPPINLEPFRELARRTNCGTIRHRLFLIDRQLVFWGREGTCADLRFSYILYGRTIFHRLCDYGDSIAGPRGGCTSAGRYAHLFTVIGQHLDDPDLGLGYGHTVEPIDF